MMSDLSRYGSLYNRLGEPATARRPRSVLIHDLTLEGDGEEMAGVRISTADRTAIARALSELGVPRLSVLGNSPMPSAEDIRSAEQIIALDLPAKLGSFVKTKEEIDLAARIGLWGVTILVGVNDALLPPGVTGADVIERSRALTSRAKEAGLHTCFMGMDATRTRPEFLQQVILALEPSCDEFTLGDSLGVIAPWGLRHLVELATAWTKLPIQVHLHNHTSMGVANALAATLGGAAIIQTTVNGMGEFTGLVALEEFAVAASLHLGVTTGVDLKGLQAVSELVANATGVRPHLQKPVVGRVAFCIPETEEIQQAYWGLAETGRLEEGLPYPPRLVSNSVHMSIGSRCNEYTVRYNLAVRGWTASPTTIERILRAVRERAAAAEGYYLMSEAEFADLLEQGGYELSPLREPPAAH
jgi:isopropylmalate/homocitrate/citramalate synthase